MKKALILCLSVILVMTMSVSAFATGFVGSPSGNSAPTLEGFEHGDEDCDADVNVVGYNDRDKLDDELREEFEEAYDKLKNDPDIGDASDVFVVEFTNCDNHNEHGETTIILSDEEMDNLGDLWEYINGEWHKVRTDKYSVNGDKMTLLVDGTSIYAITLADESVSPETDSLSADGISPVWYVLMAVSAAGLVVAALLYSRVKANG